MANRYHLKINLIISEALSLLYITARVRDRVRGRGRERAGGRAGRRAGRPAGGLGRGIQITITCQSPVQSICFYCIICLCTNVTKIFKNTCLQKFAHWKQQVQIKDFLCAENVAN
jgi:hypothetical protein